MRFAIASASERKCVCLEGRKDQIRAAFPDIGDEPWEALTGGRSNRIWRAGGWVIKELAPAAYNPLFPSDPSAEARALAALGENAGPEYGGSCQIGPVRYVCYRYIAGERSKTASLELAHGLAGLHKINDIATLRCWRGGSASILSQALFFLDAAGKACKKIPRFSEIGPVLHPVLIHGDPVPANVIISEGRAHFIDWQCCARGDPAEDLAIALSPAMNLIYGDFIPDAAAEARFLEAYGAHDIALRYRALKRCYHYRMWAYCLWKVDQGQADYEAGAELEWAAFESQS